jgi:hypothetical protein
MLTGHLQRLLHAKITVPKQTALGLFILWRQPLIPVFLVEILLLHVVGIV